MSREFVLNYFLDISSRFGGVILRKQNGYLELDFSGYLEIIVYFITGTIIISLIIGLLVWLYIMYKIFKDK